MDNRSLEVLWAWGKLWHFPYLSLSPKPIRHGRESWHTFLSTLTFEQHEALVAYITRWNILAGGYVPDPLDEEVEQEQNARVLQKAEVQI